MLFLHIEIKHISEITYNWFNIYVKLIILKIHI